MYLDAADRDRLERLVGRLETTKSDVLRRGLDALERQLTDPAAHPALRIIGIAQNFPRREHPRENVAHDHDRFLADSEIASWEAERESRHDE